MDEAELQKLLSRLEGLKLEFKRELYQVRHAEPQMRERHWGELIKDVLALANGNVGVAGQIGYLIVGAGDCLTADGHRELLDVGEPGLTRQDILQKINSACDPPLADLFCETVVIESRRLWVITIPPSPHLHETTRRLDTVGGATYTKHTAFVRRADGIHPASASECHAIITEKQWGVPLTPPAPSHDPAQSMHTPSPAWRVVRITPDGTSRNDIC